MKNKKNDLEKNLKMNNNIKLKGKIKKKDLEKNHKMINKGNGDKIKAIFTFIGVFLFVIAYTGTVSGYLIVSYNKMQ